METETLKHFKYEIVLGAPIPMPKPTINFFPHNQYSVQQYLHTLCKENVGALGKRGRTWTFGDEFEPKVKLSTRPDIIQLFEFSEQLGIIEPKAPEGGSPPDDPEAFVPYQLSKAYWDKFDKFTS